MADQEAGGKTVFSHRELPSEIEALNQYVEEITTEGMGTDKLMERYSEWAENYDNDLMQKGMVYNAPKDGSQVLADLIGQKKEARILDAGAGTGLVGEVLHEMGYKNIDALDPSPEMLEIAKRKGVYKNLLESCIGPSKTDIEENAYDVLIGVGIFVPNHVGPDCFEEMIRVVKPGGYVITVMWDGVQGNYDETMKRHEVDGKWKCAVRKEFPNFYLDDAGVTCAFQVL